MILEKKSLDNQKAIDLLIEQELYTPAVHCAYYSSLQLLIHYTIKYTGLSEDEISKEANGPGSHNFYLNKYYMEIRRLDHRNASQFLNFVNKFKRKRTEADYTKTEIGLRDSIIAKECNLKIHKFVKAIDNEGECKNIFLLEA